MHPFIKACCFSGLLLTAGVAAGQPVAVNRSPVRSATDAFQAMFGLPADDTAYFFRVNLPGDNFITMQFDKLSYWPEGKLGEAIDIARLAQEQLRDSFSGNATAQRIALSVPAANYPVVAAVRETGKDQRIMMLGNDGAAPLRIAHDTISVRRAFHAAQSDTAVHPAVLYSFLLKDLSEIQSLAADSALVGAVSRKFDSLVARRRAGWKKQDAPVHSFAAELDLRGTAGPASLKTRSSYLLLRRFDVYAEFGLSALTTNTGFTGNAKISYTWQESEAPASLFAALSLSGLAFARRVDDRIERQYQNFINLEYGFAFTQGRGGFPIYRTSAGFGYQIDRYNVSVYDFQYRVFLSYSVSRAITLIADTYFFRRNDQTKQERFGIGGMTVLLRLL